MRDETAQALRALGFTVTDSKTNFCSRARIRLFPEENIMQRCGKAAFLCGTLRCRVSKNWVRITVGTAAQMQRLVDVTKQILDARHSAAR